MALHTANDEVAGLTADCQQTSHPKDSGYMDEAKAACCEQLSAEEGCKVEAHSLRLSAAITTMLQGLIKVLRKAAAPQRTVHQ